MTRKVVSVRQSSVLADRWCLTLSCGHELWVQSAREPREKTAVCPWPTVHLQAKRADSRKRKP